MSGVYHHTFRERATYKMIVQPVMVYGMETVPVTSSHVTKLEVTEMNVLMRMRPHGAHLSNYYIWERLPI